MKTDAENVTAATVFAVAKRDNKSCPVGAVDKWSPKNGKGADFIRATAFGKIAENMERFCCKGQMLGVVGKLDTGSYEKDGQKHYTTNVVADKV